MMERLNHCVDLARLNQYSKMDVSAMTDRFLPRLDDLKKKKGTSIPYSLNRCPNWI